MCSEESVTMNLTEVATEPEIDDFFVNFESETIYEEKLAKFQEPRNTITINSKECLISFNEYETCGNIRSKSTSNKIFDGKYSLQTALLFRDLLKFAQRSFA